LQLPHTQVAWASRPDAWASSKLQFATCQALACNQPLQVSRDPFEIFDLDIKPLFNRL